MSDLMKTARLAITRVNELRQEFAALVAQQNVVAKLIDATRSPTAHLDSIEGRRIFYTLVGSTTFQASDAGNRGAPVSMLVSQDGPFIATHFPIALWRPTLPNTTTLFGHWRPVSAYPLPNQGTNTAGDDFDDDIISISYDILDGGSQRNFQNASVPPILSSPNNFVPLPMPTLFTPNSTIVIQPTYEAISFTSAVAPTQGTITFAFPGYRIANL
jgi:hypothetical protein